MHHLPTLVAVAGLTLALWSPAAVAQGDEMAPTLTVRTGPAEYGDYRMQVGVQGVTLTSPGSGAGHHLVYYLHGAPAPSDAYGRSSTTTSTSFFFTNLSHGDVVGVELVKSDGASYDPPLIIEQAAASPQLIIESDAPTAAGNYTMNIDVSAFDLVSPGHTGSSPGEGHLHYYVNGAPAPVSKNGTTYDTAYETYFFVNLSEGDVVSVELVDHDHTPLTPRIVASQRVGSGPSVEITSGTPTPGAHALEVSVRDHDGLLAYGLNGGVVATTNATSHAFDDLEAGDVLSVELVNATGAPLTPPFMMTHTVQTPGALDHTGATVSAPLPGDPPTTEDPPATDDEGQAAPPVDTASTTRGIVIAAGVLGAVAAALAATWVAIRKGR